jgi:hypothetical protein
MPAIVTSQEIVYSNKVYPSPQGSIPSHKKYISLKAYVLPVAFSDTIQRRKIGLSKVFRQFLSLRKIDQILIKADDAKPTDQPATLLQVETSLVISPTEEERIN